MAFNVRHLLVITLENIPSFFTVQSTTL